VFISTTARVLPRLKFRFPLGRPKCWGRLRWPSATWAVHLSVTQPRGFLADSEWDSAKNQGFRGDRAARPIV